MKKKLKLIVLPVTFLIFVTFLCPRANAYNRSGHTFNFWPLFHYQEEAGESKGEFLCSVFYFERSPQASEYSLWPLFNIRQNKEELSREGQFLWPLGSYRSTPLKKRVWFFPIYYYNKDVFSSGEGEESDYKLLPFIYGGVSTEEGADYFAFFPLGGKLHHWLGRDQIRFFLFPLYADSLDNGYRSRYFLWPVFSYARGEEGEGAYRFWPFFGRGYKEGVYRKTFVLWPLFNFQKSGLDTENPTETRMLLPFYAYQESLTRTSRGVFPPFFTYTHNRRQNYEEWHWLWPFFSRTIGADRSGAKFWPLWGYRQKGDFKLRFALWPLYWSFEDNAERERKSTQLFVPFYRNEFREAKEGKFDKRYLQLWPLFHYEEDEEGRKEFSFLSPLWVKRDSALAKHSSSLWTLYERSWDRDGNSSSQALCRLYRREKTSSSCSLALIYLFDYERRGEEEKRISFAKGFLEYRRSGSGKFLRLLYFIKIPWGKGQET